MNIIGVLLSEKHAEFSMGFVGRNELMLNSIGRIFNAIVGASAFSHSVYVNARLYNIEKRTALKFLQECEDRKERCQGQYTKGVLFKYWPKIRRSSEGVGLCPRGQENAERDEIRESGKLTQVNFLARDCIEAGPPFFSSG